MINVTKTFFPPQEEYQAILKHAWKTGWMTNRGMLVLELEKKLKNETLFHHHNFGHDGPETFHGIGINAKMSELQVAMGLSIFTYFNVMFEKIKIVADTYNEAFKNTNLKLLKTRNDTKWNYCYYPVIFNNETQLLQVKIALEKEKEKENARRYFYPNLDALPYVNATKCQTSRKIASSILCLPLCVGLKNVDIERIINIVKSNLC